MAQTHYFLNDRVHFTWDAGNEPALEIDSGDTVIVETRDVTDNQLRPGTTAEAIPELDWERVYPLAGPRCAAPSPATRSPSRSSTCTPAAGARPRSSPASAC